MVGARAPPTGWDIKQRVGEVLSVMKGANGAQGQEHRPVILNGEWCAESAIRTLNSHEGAEEAGEVVHGGEVCAVRDDGGLKAVHLRG